MHIVSRLIYLETGWLASLSATSTARDASAARDLRTRVVSPFGGLISGGEYNGTFSNAIQRIHLPTGSATTVGHLPTPLAHAMGTLVGGQILVIGGSAPAGTSNAILRFDPTTNKISRAATLPQPITDAAVAAIGNTAYLLGGISSGPLDTITLVRVATAR
jgi:Galactose oxidase, central domain